MKKTGYLLVIVALTLSLSLPAIPAQAAKQTWTAIAGGLSKDGAINLNAFFPHTVEIAVRDTVRWKFEEFHTVTFLSGEQPPPFEVEEGGKRYFNPQVFFPAGGTTYDGTGYRNSGAPPLDPAAIPKFRYSLTFTKAGEYDYICMVHGPLMAGKVVVKEKAKESPSAALARGRKEQAAALKAGQAAFVKSKPVVQGNTAVVSLIGDYPKGGYTFLRFTREPLVVKRGATVTWKMADPTEIHTVTFLSGQKPPEFVLVEPQKQGPPKLRFNPKVEAPTAAKTYEGKGYGNSGIMFTPGPGAPPNAPSEFSLTFTKAGRYEYVCMVHFAEGMKGTIVVK